MSTNVPVADLFGIEAPQQFTVEVQENLDTQAQAYVPNTSASYVFRKEHIRNLLAFEQAPNGDALYISGPTGSGKTSIVTEFYGRLNRPLISVTASGTTEGADFIGFFGLVSENGGEPSMKFMDGSLTMAMRHGYVLLINEIDLVDPAELSSLNDVLEGRPLVIKETGEVIKPHPNFRFIATGNTVGAGDETGRYLGTQPQNIAAMDRYRIFCIGYADAEVEKVILVGCGLPESIAAPMVRLANEVRTLFIEGELSVTLSTRTLIRWAKLALNFKGAPNPLEMAFEQALLNRTSVEERAAIERLAEDIFGDLYKGH